MGSYQYVRSVRFIQCCDSQKARNTSNCLGVISRYRQNAAFCLVFQRNDLSLSHLTML